MTLVVAFPLNAAVSSADTFSTSGLALSNVTAPGPRYFDHRTVTGGRGVVIGALVPLVYFMSSDAQSVNKSGADNDAVLGALGYSADQIRDLRARKVI